MEITLDKTKLEEASKIFGEEVVQTVMESIDISDPDVAYVTLEDAGLYEEAECLSFIYWEN